MAGKPRKIDSYGLVEPFAIDYEDRLVAFLDILGFSKMVCDRRDDDVEFVANLIPDMMRTHQGNVLRDDLQVTIISDSIILSVKAERDDVLKDLFNICVIVGRLQHELALNGYYMRGGISVGKMFHNQKKNMIVGPAYITAYLLESKKCIVPRVVIGEDVNQFYRKSYEQMKETLNSEFTQFYYKGNLINSFPSEHPLWVGNPEVFVDYASTFIGREKAGFKGTVKRFLEHIENALHKGVAIEKYIWLAQYAIETIEESDWEDEQCRASCNRINSILIKLRDNNTEV
ncbi:hypothetical protein [Vibrio cholerae]|uniref:hypothetical protein n=1 Tax=Vibrio cholerae TaxID=666 RepID=UPI000BA92C9C|nr:hypothetical protein [Vibrio cholerae]EJL6271823.1 hypothetical protein [Vibrio cholerae]EJL6293321.1 hypothetical protein [Vibrio cholerae]PAS34930.1 hypothetical protein CGT70_17910 [Vibrio cholerae]GHW03066.1 hypothetical protein VCSRO191_3447 [Vibrio cholerae]